MLDAILGIASSSGLGAIVGLLGSWMAKREQRKLDEMNNAHELAMGHLDLEESKLERTHALDMADKNIEETEVEGAIASDIVAGEAFAESQRSSRTPSGIAWIDGFRAMMRPVITIYLLLVVTFITYKIHKLIGGLESLGATDLYALYSHIINQTVFLSVTVVLWWFGSRIGNKK